jgi:uracil-DNA glycosylase
LPVEIARCHRYMERELTVLPELRVLLPLGKIAFDAGLRLLEGAGFVVPRPRPRFAHGARFELVPRPGGPAPRPLIVLASYHPSRQNTQTGKLTRQMLDDVFAAARRELDALQR